MRKFLISLTIVLSLTLSVQAANIYKSITGHFEGTVEEQLNYEGDYIRSHYNLIFLKNNFIYVISIKYNSKTNEHNITKYGAHYLIVNDELVITNENGYELVGTIDFIDNHIMVVVKDEQIKNFYKKVGQ